MVWNITDAGTVRDITRFCGICGEIGHRDWQCPKDKLQSFQAKVINDYIGIFLTSHDDIPNVIFRRKEPNNVRT